MTEETIEAGIADTLSGLLVELNRSFLQYTHECWPWTVGQEDAADVVHEAGEVQQRDVAALCQVLLDRGEPIDFGSYPTDYTASHYVSLQSLMELLTSSQEIVSARAADAAEACAASGFVGDLTRAISDNQRAILERLESLSKSVAG